MLKRSFVAFITSVILAAPVVALGQTDDRFDRTLVAVTDPRQVTISAALILAGYAGEPDDPAAVPLREEIRKGLATVDPDLKRRLSEFYTANRRPTLDEATDAIRYRSLGVLANMPPSFSIAVPQDRIPIDLRDILGFASLAGRAVSHARLPRAPAATDRDLGSRDATGRLRGQADRRCRARLPAYPANSCNQRHGAPQPGRQGDPPGDDTDPEAQGLHRSPALEPPHCGARRPD
ncbi:MAG: hypothetical protein IPF53_20240 [Blastocatellia bacterium]|nr:hypothetical protein [Blastocatellia bacterium]